MSKKRKREDEGAAVAAPELPPATTVLPPAISGIGAVLCVAAALIMLVLFARAVPDAAVRAKEGLARVAEGACSALQPTPVNAALGELPAAAPDFKLKDYAGRELKLSDLRGSVVLVNFWATWCSTCVVEMPSMERLVSRLSGKPFRLLAVSVDEEWQPVRQFFKKGTPLEILLDPARSVPKLFGTDKFPESFLIDRDGQVRYYIVSNRDWDTGDVVACIDGLLQ